MNKKSFLLLLSLAVFVFPNLHPRFLGSKEIPSPVFHQLLKEMPIEDWHKILDARRRNEANEDDWIKIESVGRAKILYVDVPEEVIDEREGVSYWYWYLPGFFKRIARFFYHEDWLNKLVKLFKLWEGKAVLSFRGNRKTNDKTVSLFRDCESIRTVVLSETPIEGLCIPYLPKKTKYLFIDRCPNIKGNRLYGFPNTLKELSLVGVSLEGRPAGELGKLPQLANLYIGRPAYLKEKEVREDALDYVENALNLIGEVPGDLSVLGIWEAPISVAKIFEKLERQDVTKLYLGNLPLGEAGGGLSVPNGIGEVLFWNIDAIKYRVGGAVAEGEAREVLAREELGIQGGEGKLFDLTDLYNHKMSDAPDAVIEEASFYLDADSGRERYKLRMFGLLRSKGLWGTTFLTSEDKRIVRARVTNSVLKENIEENWGGLLKKAERSGLLWRTITFAPRTAWAVFKWGGARALRLLWRASPKVVVPPKSKFGRLFKFLNLCSVGGAIDFIDIDARGSDADDRFINAFLSQALEEKTEGLSLVVRELNLQDTLVTGKFVEDLSSLGVEKLVLAGCQKLQEDKLLNLKHFSDSDKLHYLDFSRTAITGKCLKSVKSYIKTLLLGEMYKLREDNLIDLVTAEDGHLETLGVWNVRGLRGAFLANLASAFHLESLYIGKGIGLSDEFEPSFFTFLKTFVMWGGRLPLSAKKKETGGGTPDVLTRFFNYMTGPVQRLIKGDKGMGFVHKLPSELENLYLIRCKGIRDREIESLKPKLFRLRVLGLVNSKITGRGLEEAFANYGGDAGNPPVLEELDLSLCKKILGRKYIRPLKEKLTSLRIVTLTGSRLEGRENIAMEPPPEQEEEAELVEIEEGEDIEEPIGEGVAEVVEEED